MRRILLVLTFMSFAAWSQPAQPQVQAPIVVKVEMPTPHRDFLGYLQALGPLIAACVAVGVGLSQWAIQRKHLAHSLFDKRFKIYTAVSEYLPRAIDGRIHPALADFLLDTAHAEFLFGQDITDLFGEIHQNSIKLAVVQREIQEYLNAKHEFETGLTNDFDPLPNTMQTLSSRKTELLAWFIKTQEHRNDLFRDYLHLGAALPWYARLERDLNAWTDRLDQTVNRVHR
jgi:hypothetical protein